MTREFADGVLPYGFQMPAEGISSIWVYNRTAQIWLDFLTLISTKNQTQSASCAQKSVYVFGLQTQEPAPLLDASTLSNHLSAYCELLGDTAIFCSLKVLPWIITLFTHSSEESKIERNTHFLELVDSELVWSSFQCGLDVKVNADCSWGGSQRLLHYEHQSQSLNYLLHHHWKFSFNLKSSLPHLWYKLCISFSSFLLRVVMASSLLIIWSKFHFQHTFKYLKISRILNVSSPFSSPSQILLFILFRFK